MQQKLVTMNERITVMKMRRIMAMSKIRAILKEHITLLRTQSKMKCKVSTRVICSKTWVWNQITTLSRTLHTHTETEHSMGSVRVLPFFGLWFRGSKRSFGFLSSAFPISPAVYTIRSALLFKRWKQIKTKFSTKS